MSLFHDLADYLSKPNVNVKQLCICNSFLKFIYMVVLIFISFKTILCQPYISFSKKNPEKHENAGFRQQYLKYEISQLNSTSFVNHVMEVQSFII